MAPAYDAANSGLAWSHWHLTHELIIATTLVVPPKLRNSETQTSKACYMPSHNIYISHTGESPTQHSVHPQIHIQIKSAAGSRLLGLGWVGWREPGVKCADSASLGRIAWVSHGSRRVVFCASFLLGWDGVWTGPDRMRLQSAAPNGQCAIAASMSAWGVLCSRIGGACWELGGVQSAGWGCFVLSFQFPWLCIPAHASSACGPVFAWSFAVQSTPARPPVSSRVKWGAAGGVSLWPSLPLAAAA